MAHYDDVVFPTTVSFGTAGGPMTAVDLVFVGSGYRYANARWAQKLRRLSFKLSPHRIADVAAFARIFEALEGPLHSGLARDWSDWNTTTNKMGSDGAAFITAFDQPLRNTVTGLYAGDGVTRTFQMVKRYLIGASATHNRTITKPQSGTILAAVDGIAKTEGSPTDFSVNYATGVITFQTAPGATGSPTAVAVTWGGSFYVPVAFMDNDFETVLRTLKTDEATVELQEVRGV